MILVGSFYKDMKPLPALDSSKIISNITTDTTTVGDTLDCQNAGRVLFNIFTGIVTDGDYEFKLFHGDASNMSDEAEVSATDILGTLPNWVADTDDNKLVSVELILRKRYCRLKVVSTNTSSGAYVGAVASLGDPKDMPVQ